MTRSWTSESLPFFLLLLVAAACGSAPPTHIPVGVVLNLGSVVGRTGMAGLQMALEDFYAARPNFTTRLLLLPRDSHRDTVTAASTVISLLERDGAQAVIGPQTSSQAEFIADLANKTHVPVLSFSATSPSLSSRNTPYFIRTGIDDSAQAAPIAAIFKAYNWRQAVPIYQDDEYGAAMIPFLIDALREVECVVPYRSVVPPAAPDVLLKQELYKLKTMQSRVFVVHMVRELGTRLLALADELGMVDEGYAWIVTDEITSMVGATEFPSALHSMQGVIGVKPYVPPSPELERFKDQWKRRHRRNLSADPLEAAPSQFVLWAYDTATALATAVERAGISDHIPSTVPLSGDLSSLGVSPTGPRLLQALSAVEFDGLSGRFLLANGQIRCDGFEVVSFTGGVDRTVGFWSKERGLMRRWNGKASGLSPVIWPGETVAVPRGWEEPVTGRKLRIAVPGPAQSGFHAFLRMDWDSNTNTSTVEGLVIDVFEAAVKQLPYALRWEYVPFQTNDGRSAGNYNDLVRNVSAGVFDGVVGDMTITDYRAAYVDFTMPFTTSGVSMVVPKKDYRSRSAWIFLKPLTGKLWVVSCTFFFAIGIIIWFLEHRINGDFRGEVTQQLGTIFSFSLSTLVFAQREKIVSSLSKLVLIMWLFVVLILQSSYTASLTSMLTVEQLRPIVTDISELINRNQRVGYLKNSFVKQKLLNMGFKGSNLVPLASLEQYAEKLALGSDYGGVAAIIDETPYLKLFLKSFCTTNYTMAEQQLKTGGFGFAFPKGSPLVADLSRAILNITEGDTMLLIEHKWLGDPSTCSDQGSPVSSNSLGFMSFWGLFLITGSITILAFIVFVVRFLYENAHILQRGGNNNGSLFGRVKKLFKKFDEKAPSTRNGGSTRTGHGSETPLSMSMSVVTRGSTTPILPDQVWYAGTGTSTPAGDEEITFSASSCVLLVEEVMVRAASGESGVSAS